MTETPTEVGLHQFITDPSTWRYKRMNALPLSVAPTNPPLPVNPETVGVSVADFAAPKTYAFTRPPNPERDPRHPAFSRADERSETAPTETDVDAWLDAAAAEIDKLRTALPPRLAAIELGHWEKLTVQRGEAIPYFMKAQGPGHADQPMPARFLKILEVVADFYAKRRGSGDMRPDPASTNAGAPTFIKGPPGKVVSASLFGDFPDLAQMLQIGDGFARAVGLPRSVVHAYGVSKRSGPVRKALAQLRHVTGQQWEQVAEATGTQQRNRVVMMAPSGANRVLRPLYAALNSVRRATFGLWHPGGPDARPAGAYAFHYESDISGYDTSVSPELQDAVLSAWQRAFPDLTRHVTFWRYMETRPLVCPSWGLVDGVATIAVSIGGIHSGLKLTSEFGSFLNVAATLYALECCGITTADVWAADPSRAGALIYIFGDDCRVSTNAPIDPDTWRAAFSILGLKCDVVEGGVFLARYTLPDLNDAPIAGRVVQQTMSNEHERFGEGAKGIAFLGFLARTEGVERLPEALQTAIWNVVQHAKWIRDAGNFKSVAALRLHIQTNPSVRAIISDALASAAQLDWYQENVRSAEHSPTAAAIVRYADVAFTDLGARARAEDLVTDAIAARVAALAPDARLNLAIDGYYATATGSKAAERWLAQVTPTLTQGDRDVLNAITEREARNVTEL